ncbi:uncharacterized protein RCC_09130 [Ramularia collo-cygni]|uniref:Uncharacterized protein n=1 Tax=Ramularia collo-cygni TaxID=112498 RepID=A0A2D3V1Z5_9PEZI|nr:uncharacterized protein RCC_09130 [Ramularia collo-cygni]CZT23416.1 uncharacterized protein RCC_09130 [Ramularia collo-cygni]
MTGLRPWYFVIKPFMGFSNEITRRDIHETIQRYTPEKYDALSYIPEELSRPWFENHDAIKVPSTIFDCFPPKLLDFLHFAIFYAKGDQKAVHSAINEAYRERLRRIPGDTVLDTEHVFQAAAIVTRKLAEVNLAREAHRKGEENVLAALKKVLPANVSHKGMLKVTPEELYIMVQKAVRDPQQDEGLEGDGVMQHDDDLRASLLDAVIADSHSPSLRKSVPGSTWPPGSFAAPSRTTGYSVTSPREPPPFPAGNPEHAKYSPVRPQTSHWPQNSLSPGILPNDIAPTVKQICVKNTHQPSMSAESDGKQPCSLASSSDIIPDASSRTDTAASNAVTEHPTSMKGRNGRIEAGDGTVSNSTKTVEDARTKAAAPSSAHEDSEATHASASDTALEANDTSTTVQTTHVTIKATEHIKDRTSTSHAEHGANVHDQPISHFRRNNPASHPDAVSGTAPADLSPLGVSSMPETGEPELTDTAGESDRSISTAASVKKRKFY